MTYFDEAQKQFPSGLYSCSTSKTIRSLVPATTPTSTTITKFGQPLVCGSDASFVLTGSDQLNLKNPVIGLGSQSKEVSLAFWFRPMHASDATVIQPIRNGVVNVSFVGGNLTLTLTKGAQVMTTSAYIGRVHQSFFIVLNIGASSIELWVDGLLASSYEMTEEQQAMSFTTASGDFLVSGPIMIDGITILPYAMRYNQIDALHRAGTSWLDYTQFCIEQAVSTYDCADINRPILFSKNWPEEGWNSDGTSFEGTSSNQLQLTPLLDDLGVAQAGSWYYSLNALELIAGSTKTLRLNWDYQGSGVHLFYSVNGGAETELTASRTSVPITSSVTVRVLFDVASTAVVNSLSVSVFESLTVMPSISGPNINIDNTKVTPRHSGSPMFASDVLSTVSPNTSVVIPYDTEAAAPTASATFSFSLNAMPSATRKLLQFSAGAYINITTAGVLSVLGGTILLNGAAYSGALVLREWNTVTFNLTTPVTTSLTLFETMNVTFGNIGVSTKAQVAGDFKRLARSAPIKLTNGSDNQLAISNNTQPDVYQRDWSIVSGG